MIRDKGAEINNNNEKKKHTHIFFLCDQMAAVRWWFKKLKKDFFELTLTAVGIRWPEQPPPVGRVR
jgi:hypothetical protein